MQVDTNPSTPMRLRPIPNITSTTLQEMSRKLGHTIYPLDNDNSICKSLDIVWLTIYKALSQDPMMQPLANQDKFEQNVKQKGEQVFINLLRDIRRNNNSWGDLLGNGTSFLLADLKCFDHHLSLDVFLKQNLKGPNWSQSSLSQALVDGMQ